ncbi:pyridoxal-phosphate dependent enzyme, partial [archaeon]|nr:pyridoxal-phosphate dependent enzyme [archaeon]
EKLGYDIEIIGVETKGADTIALSLKEDKLIRLENIDSIAKTLGAKTTTQEIFSIMKEHVSQMIVVDDKAAVEALFKFLEREKILIEPATSCLIAAALENKDLFKNKTTIFVICGSNVSIDEAMNWKEEFGVLL